MKRYCLTYAQTTIAPHDDGFPTLTEARKALREAIREEVAACQRHHKKAYVHRCGDSAEITLGQDRRSAMWTRLALVSF